MRMSVRETRANFARAISAAERGEHVIITKNGRPVAELGPPQVAKSGSVLARMRAARDAVGWEEGSLTLPLDFDDPAFGRQVLGLDD